ncbi:tyrosine-protein phosphatase [Streptomyces sp. NBC_00996]|uniref:tyrosine-protein phosphatase n=1 Tax=Streptomyces sp. NBC_00996 TaxID=2903710 RepID=UPI0038645961|nr:tyrosine-protein phosphatase [Streptomyces sp. NBC_00996]
MIAAALLADWHATNPHRTQTWPAYGSAPAEVMTLFLSALKSRHGSVQNYVTGALGLDTTFTSELRAVLLEEPSAPSL